MILVTSAQKLVAFGVCVDLLPTEIAQYSFFAGRLHGQLVVGAMPRLYGCGVAALAGAFVSPFIRPFISQVGGLNRRIFGDVVGGALRRWS